MTLFKNEILSSESFLPSVYGIGYIGVGNYRTTVNRKKTKEYSKWNNILHRGYDKKYKERNPTYKDCYVADTWHNFQNFAKWFEENYVEGWELDKDILINGNKIYSPETCCFVPREINALFKSPKEGVTSLPSGVSYDKFNKKYKVSVRVYGKFKTEGRYNTIEEAFQAYKTVKEKHIKEVANKWRGQITEEVYQTMTNYKIT